MSPVPAAWGAVGFDAQPMSGHVDGVIAKGETLQRWHGDLVYGGCPAPILGEVTLPIAHAGPSISLLAPHSAVVTLTVLDGATGNVLVRDDSRGIYKHHRFGYDGCSGTIVMWSYPADRPGAPRQRLRYHLFINCAVVAHARLVSVCTA